MDLDIERNVSLGEILEREGCAPTGPKPEYRPIGGTMTMTNYYDRAKACVPPNVPCELIQDGRGGRTLMVGDPAQAVVTLQSNGEVCLHTIEARDGLALAADSRVLTCRA